MNEAQLDRAATFLDQVEQELSELGPIEDTYAVRLQRRYDSLIRALEALAPPGDVLRMVAGNDRAALNEFKSAAALTAALLAGLVAELE